MKRIISLSVMTVLLQACAVVQLTPEGEQARILSSAEVKNCTKLGTTTVSVTTKVLFIQLDPEKIEADLLNIARNGVVDFKGADTVVALGEPKDGKQTFGVYECVK